MSSNHRQRATEQFEALILELGGLRNASTRDPGFKAWRQNTLTLIQRLWPGDQTRSDRFRRVPFSPPSNRMSVKLTREFYERGCAEAVVLLRALATEIVEQGLPHPGSAPTSPDSEMARDVDFPIVDLPREGAAPDSGVDPTPPDLDLDPNARPRPSNPRPVLPKSRASEPATPPAKARERAPQEEPAQKLDRRKGSRFGAWARKSHKPRLKDMLGFTDEAAPERAAEAPEPPALQHEAPPPPIAEPPAPPALQHEAPAPPIAEPREHESHAEPGTIVVRGAAPAAAAAPPAVAPPPAVTPPPAVEPPAAVTPPPAVARPPIAAAPPPIAAAPPPPASPTPVKVSFDELPEMDIDPEFSPLLQEFDSEPEPEVEPEYEPEPPSHEEQEVREAADEFLRTSPVLRSEARPVKRDERPSTPQPSTAVAIALVAIAGQIPSLGIPEGQRAGARAALLDLARQLDDHSLTWSGLRESMLFLMEYPPLARRVVPLLIPYLDIAA